MYRNIIIVSMISFASLFGCKSTTQIDPIKKQTDVINKIKVEKVATSHPGYKIYQENGCVNCHGDRLQGSENGPPLVYSMYKRSTHSKGRFFASIRYGTEQDHWYFGDMPANPQLTDDEIDELILFISKSIKINNI